MTRRGNDDYHGGGSGWRFEWRPEKMRDLHELGKRFGMTEDSVPRLHGGGGRAPLVEVVIYAMTPVPSDDLSMIDVTVRDPRTGRDGMIRATTAELLTAIGECHSHELIRVPADRIAWKLKTKPPER